MSTLLLCPLHDSESRLLPIIREILPGGRLAATWRNIAPNYTTTLAVASPITDPRSIAALEKVGWQVIVRPDDDGDRGLWRMVRVGLEQSTDRLHFCDLDRLLHWLEHYPDELRRLPEVWARADVVMLARSPRAFASHPPCQTLTEGLANAVIASRVGIPDADAFSGSYLWSRKAIEALAEAPPPHDLRFYSEGVMAPFRAGCTVSRHQVEGLEWETPDQFPEEIARLGFANWLAQFESPKQWLLRTEMAKIFVESALR